MPLPKSPDYPSSWCPCREPHPRVYRLGHGQDAPRKPTQAVGCQSLLRWSWQTCWLQSHCSEACLSLTHTGCPVSLGAGTRALCLHLGWLSPPRQAEGALYRLVPPPHQPASSAEPFCCPFWNSLQCGPGAGNMGSRHHAWQEGGWENILSLCCPCSRRAGAILATQ